MKYPLHTGARAYSIIIAIPAILIAFSLFGCSENNCPIGPSEAEADSTWTVMVFDSADGASTVPWTIFDNFQAIPGVHSGAYVNLLALQDTFDDSTKIMYIDENNDMVLLEEMGERCMGSEETLYDFVAYAKENYPADRYIMCFFGHGGSWFGCCGDGTSHNGLRVHEMKNALARTGDVDLIFFTAPCIMGGVEVAYELRNCTEFVVASEAMSSFYHWDRPMEHIFAEMHQNPTISSIDIAEMAVEEYWNDWTPEAPWGPDTLMTMSAVRTDKLDALADAIDDLAVAYLAQPDTFMTRMERSAGNVRRFEDFVADLSSLVRHLLSTENDPSMINKLEMIPTRLQEAVIAERHAPFAGDVGGLTIFLPESDFQWMSYYRGEEDMTLEFADDTHWDELMELLIEQPAAYGDPNDQLLLIRDGVLSRF